ncbi:MAG: LysR family transcriptional regulator, partial [Rhodobiaceae bacterium]|nr:LysR family transcriptional regulator [Rhodobiaceae bacterium]
EALGLTQPAISDQVRKLEAEYDLRLFDRHRRQVTVTEAGRRLLEITHRLFEVEQQAQDFLSQTRAVRSGLLKIIVSSAHHILHILGPFREKFPDVHVSVSVGNTESIIDNLNAYEADIGEVGGAPEGRGFESVYLGETPIVAFAAADHPLAARDGIAFAELARYPLVMRERGSKTREKLEEQADARGIRLSAQVEAEGREAVREIVAAGGGIGVVSEAEFGQDARLVKVPITDARLIMDETLICLRERQDSKLIRAFMDMARERAADYRKV